MNRRQNKCIIIIKMSNETLDFSMAKKQIVRQKKKEKEKKSGEKSKTGVSEIGEEKRDREGKRENRYNDER